MTDDPARLRTQRRASYAVLLVAVVVAGVLLWRDLRDDRAHARAGSFASADSTPDARWRRVVLVPGARYDVSAVVRDDVTDDLAVHRRQAPEGGRFVGLVITRADTGGPVVPGPSRTSVGVSAAGFTVIADGRRYPLEVDRNLVPRPNPPTRLPVAGWLAVAGKANRLSLETAWEGRRQQVDLRTGTRDAGSFAALYRQRSIAPAPTTLTSCGAATWTAGWRAGPGADATCVYRADRLAWWAGKGWARTGRQWLVLTVKYTAPTTPIRRVGGRDQSYYSGYSSSSSNRDNPSTAGERVDGRPPVAVTYDDRNGRTDDVLVFDVSATATSQTAVLSQVVAVRPRLPIGDGDVVDLSQTWTVTIRR